MAETRLFKKELTLTVLVQADSEDDAQYWVKKQLRAELDNIEEFSGIKEVTSDGDLPEGYDLDDVPDNGDDLTIRDIIAPKGIAGMRQAVDEA